MSANRNSFAPLAEPAPSAEEVGDVQEVGSTDPTSYKSLSATEVADKIATYAEKASAKGQSTAPPEGAKLRWSDYLDEDEEFEDLEAAADLVASLSIGTMGNKAYYPRGFESSMTEAFKQFSVACRKTGMIPEPIELPDWRPVAGAKIFCTYGANEEGRNAAAAAVSAASIDVKKGIADLGVLFNCLRKVPQVEDLKEGPKRFASTYLACKIAQIYVEQMYNIPISQIKAAWPDTEPRRNAILARISAVVGGPKSADFLLNALDAVIRRLVRNSCKAAENRKPEAIKIEKEAILALIEATVESSSALWIKLSPQKTIVEKVIDRSAKGRPRTENVEKKVRYLPTIIVNSSPVTVNERRMLTKVNEALVHGREHLASFKDAKYSGRNVPMYISDVSREHKRVSSFVASFNQCLGNRRRKIRETITFDRSTGTVTRQAGTGTRISPEVWSEKEAAFIAAKKLQCEEETIDVLGRMLKAENLEHLEELLRDMSPAQLYEALGLKV